MNFNSSYNDSCLFFSTSGDFTLVATYVDDIVVASRSLRRVTEFETQISAKLKVKILGDIQYILGWQITEDANGITISQGSYIHRLLEKFRMVGCHPAKTPSLKEQQIRQEETGVESQFPYREVVGSLLYIENSTRPDISQATNYAARFTSNPSSQNMIATKRILRYLKGTSSQGIRFQRVKRILTHGYADSDFANNHNSDSRSTTGFIFFTNGPIAWGSRRQQITALSTTEAEVNSLAHFVKTGKLVVWSPERHAHPGGVHTYRNQRG